MLNPFSDVPGSGGIELLIIIVALIYSAFKFIIAILNLDWDALKYYIPAIGIIALLKVEGKNLPLLIIIGLILFTVYLFYKGNTADKITEVEDIKEEVKK